VNEQVNKGPYTTELNLFIIKHFYLDKQTLFRRCYDTEHNDIIDIEHNDTHSISINCQVEIILLNIAFLKYAKYESIQRNRR
jgi:hypothetical protein